MPSSDPVVVLLNVEGFSSSETISVEIDRDEWGVMTPTQRSKLLDELASEHAANYVGWGWYIDNPVDLAEASE